MKKIISIILALALGSAAFAQTALDGLIFSEKNYVGTARTLAMGNAFTALGGDTGAMGLNPAATAVSSGINAALSLGVNTSLSFAQGTTPAGATEPYGYGTNVKTTSNKFVMPNVAVSGSYNTHRSSGVKRVTFGLAVNASNYINDKMYAEGNHYGTSLAGYFAANTSAPYSDLINSDAYYSGYAWDAVVAAQSGMMSTIANSGNTYIGITEKYTSSPEGNNIFTAGPLNQKYGRTVDGVNKESLINVGLDISDWIYVGVNLGLTSLNYKQQYYVKETAIDPNDFDVEFEQKDGSKISGNFKSLRYQYTYDAKASGMYGKFGIIMTPGKHLRVGATVQTPTFTTVNEGWQVSGETSFTPSNFDSNSTSPRGEQKYVLYQPWRTSLGVASTFGKRGLISVDYEAAFFRNMRFSSYDGDTGVDYFGEVNLDIKDMMSIQHNLRVGGEVRITDWLSARGGYNLLTSPFKNDISMKHSASAGLGFNFAGMFYCDLATRALFYPVEYIKPYGDYIYSGDEVEVASPEIRHWSALFSTIVTLGMKF